MSADAATHAVALPVLSLARNWTRVCPSADTVRAAPDDGADQVVPLSVDVRYSYPASPLTGSDEPAAEMVIEATFCQAALPPDTAGATGAVRSSFTVDDAVGAAGVHALFWPDASTERNCTIVVPSPLTGAEAPATAAVQVVPLSVERRYSYPVRPLPLSVEPDAVAFTEAAGCPQDGAPPKGGGGGRVGSVFTGGPAGGGGGGPGGAVAA